jgi:hypothetical protein
MEAKSFPPLGKYPLSNSNFLFGMVGLLPLVMLVSFTVFLHYFINCLKFMSMKKLMMALLLLASFSSCEKINDLSSTDDSVLSSGNGDNIPVSQVPAAVVAAWKAKYPSAGGQIEWEKEDGNTYKVKFWLGAERWQAIFSSTGSLLSEKRLK